MRIDNVIRTVVNFEYRLSYAGLISESADEEPLQSLQRILVDTVLADFKKIVHPFIYLLRILVRDLEKKSLKIRRDKNIH